MRHFSVLAFLFVLLSLSVSCSEGEQGGQGERVDASVSELDADISEPTEDVENSNLDTKSEDISFLDIQDGSDEESDTVLPGNPLAGECTDADDCRSAFCYPFPLGGYCTLFCSVDDDCPEDGRCYEGLMVPEPACYATCAVDGDCRDSQHCAEETLVCVPDCRVGDCKDGLECNFETGRCDEPYVCSPSEEICNEFDDDCDGFVDEGCGPVEDLPGDVGFIDLGLVPLGAASMQAVEFEIPMGTESFTFVALAEDQAFITATSLVDPTGLELVDPVNPFISINRTMPSEGALTVLVPNAPASYSPPPGKYTITLLKEGNYSLNPVMVFTKGMEPFDVPLYSLFLGEDLSGWGQHLVSDQGPAQWSLSVDGSVMSAVTSTNTWEIRDEAHKSLVLRSGAFVLGEGASILCTLAGGKGGAGAPRVDMEEAPVESGSEGFLGVAVRRSSDGAYILSKTRASNGARYLNLRFDEEEVGAAIQEDSEGELYTLDFIDEYHGSWGWLSVGFAAVLGDPVFLDLNLYFVGVEGIDSVSYLEHPEFQHLLQTFWDVYAQGNVLPGDVQSFDITGEEMEKFAYLDKTLTGAGELPELLALSSKNPESNALNVFFVSDIANSQDMHTLGIAGAIPGPPLFQGSGSSGVVVSTAYLFNDEGEPTKGGARVTAQAMAHECGHYLGLYHVTEKTGAHHDPLLDTPECADADGDGQATSGECSGSGNDNLMFWVASGRSELSREQVTVIRSNPQLGISP